jgi:hypothetical protein
MNNTQSPNEFTILDWIGCVLVGMAILHLFYFYPSFTAVASDMFTALGGELPLLTAIALKPWFGPLIGAFCTGIFALQWVGWFRKRLSRRRMIVVASFIIAVFFDSLCVLALYLPIFRMAKVVGG